MANDGNLKSKLFAFRLKLSLKWDNPGGKTINHLEGHVYIKFFIRKSSFLEKGIILLAEGYIKLRKPGTHTGGIVMPVWDGASDWSLRTCNIMLNVSSAVIGYTGPAMHQAVVTGGNEIYKFMEFIVNNLLVPRSNTHVHFNMFIY